MTPDPVRSDAVKCHFHCVPTGAAATWARHPHRL